jgi:nickel-dependent lactate racemase
LLNALNAAGVPDSDITVLIALGTHRYMTQPEMRTRFGEEVCERLNVVNHLWKDPSTTADLGLSLRGTPVKVNRLAYEADFLIGTGSIVPHIFAGWGGGAKIVMPGISNAESVAPTHALAAEDGSLLGVAGRAGNTCRREMEQVAARARLKFILNVVTDASGAPAWVGAGDPVKAHRAGVKAAEEVFLRPIPRPADIVIADAQPADLDYWQGIKALAHVQPGLKGGGTVILLAEFPDGISPTHTEFRDHALKSAEEILRDREAGEIADSAIVTTLCLHAEILARCKVICVSSFMSPQDKKRLGFLHVESAEEALAVAFAQQGAEAAVGIIEYAGDLLPRLTSR